MSDSFLGGLNPTPPPVTQLPAPSADEHYFREWTDHSAFGVENRWDNGHFMYPGRSVRNMAETYTVRRGFIRALNPNAEGDIDPGGRGNVVNARCNFQFNPQDVQRAVAARQDVHLWMNMDPIQLTQPMSGAAEFVLNLMFNREAEVAGATDKVMDPGKLLSGDVPLGSNAHQLGVLADLFVLDSIIGQGLHHSTLVEELMERGRYLQSQRSQAGTDEQTGGSIAQPFVWEADDAETGLRARMEGNSAWLIPRPVRIILSDLFMVDGIVNASNVIFHKFSRRMVPTMATVALTIEAMYIGFHRKETALTANWNRIFDVAQPTAPGEVNTGVIPGIESISLNDPVKNSPGTVAIQEQLKKGGFFNKFEYIHGRDKTQWTDFSEVSGSNPLQLEHKLNFRVKTKTDSSGTAILDLIDKQGLEVGIGIEIRSFRFRNTDGRWVDAGELHVDQKILTATRESTWYYTTENAGGFKLTIKPSVDVWGTFSGKRRFKDDTVFSFSFSHFYALRSGGAPWVRSAMQTKIMSGIRGDQDWPLGEWSFNLGSHLLG